MGDQLHLFDEAPPPKPKPQEPDQPGEYWREFLPYVKDIREQFAKEAERAWKELYIKFLTAKQDVHAALKNKHEAHEWRMQRQNQWAALWKRYGKRMVNLK